MVMITVVGAMLGIGLVWGTLASSLPQVPDFSKVQKSHISSDLFLVDRNGVPLQQLRRDHKERNLLWVKYGDVAPAVTAAVLKSEDRNFFEHRGVDWSALGASFYQRSFKESRRGGSTISMQLLKLLHPNVKTWQGFAGKARQILAVSALEDRWSKEQILEAYLNLVSFRGELRGLSAASWSFFKKNPKDLSVLESTLLSVLIRSPNADESIWAQRACWQEPSLCEALKLQLKRVVERKTVKPQDLALHLAQRISRDGRRGLVTTTVDRELQVYIQEQVQSQIQKLQVQNVHDAAVIVIENHTGEVYAYVGGSGAFSSANYVDGVRSLRQAGSTLKPFLYATAFEKNILNADSWIEDSAVDIVFDRGVYKPQNHDRQFYGWVKIKTALGSSLNVPAVKVFKLLNDESFWEKLSALNFKNLQEPDHYGPALALGVADVSLEDLAQAYRTLAQGGHYASLKFESDQDIPASYQVFAAASARQVLQILSENQNRSLGFGLSSVLALPGTAVKTGTSKDMRDNWCIGTSERFTVAVWVGNFSGEPMWNVMGVSGAAPIWQKTMRWLQEKYPSQATLPSHQARLENGDRPQAYPAARIVYPQDGMVLALDPAIPAANQKMPLLVENSRHQNLYWKINEDQKMKATETYLWSPSLGRHRFSLYEGETKLGEISVLVK